MELPPPPAWFADPDLVPPPAPSNSNLRSFGSPDYDEAFWSGEAPAPQLCGEIAALNREAMALYVEIVRAAAAATPEAEIRAKTDDLDGKFAAMHARLATLRIDQGRRNLLAHLEEESRQREDAAARMRATTAKARAAVAALLAGPDAPPYADPRCAPEAIAERARVAADEFHAHEAAEHARLCLAGTPPPPEPPWADGARPLADASDLRALLAKLPQLDFAAPPGGPGRDGPS